MRVVPGDQLLWLASGSRRRLVLVAPFVKANALRRILSVIEPAVQLDVITRWRADEVAAGVTDLEVADVIAARPASRLMLCAPLHAKLYHADDRVLVGSANLTSTALGWAVPANIEVLVEVAPDAVSASEAEIYARAFVPPDALRAAIAAAAAAMPTVSAPRERQLSDGEARPAAGWWPSLRNPEHLLLAYAGDWDRLTEAGAEAARADLMWLAPPAGLDASAMRRFAAAALLQHPFVLEVDQHLPESFGRIRRRLCVWRGHASPDDDRLLQTLLRWLLEYCPDIYALDRPRHSEILYRR